MALLHLTLLFLLFSWLLLLGMLATALGSLLFGLALVPLRAPRRWAGRARKGVLAGVPLLFLLFWHVPLHEYQNWMDRISPRLEERGAGAFGARDLVSVYGLNIVMGLGGYACGFEEVARETLLMALPQPDTLVWRSDFAMRSPKVRAAIASMVREAARLPAGRKTIDFAERRIAWHYRPDCSMKVALALNSPLFLGGRGVRDGERWRIDLRSHNAIRYPKSSPAVLVSDLRGRSITFDEGIFWILQKRQWMHTYTAVYEWSVWSDDPRLADTTRVDHTVRERALIGLWRLANRLG